MGIQGGMLISGADFKPMPQPPAALAEQGMQHHNGKDKVINRITMIRNFLLYRIMIMDFRKHRYVFFIQNPLYPFHHIPHFRLDKKAGGIQLFRGKRKGVQPDHGSPLIHQEPQRLFHKTPCCLGFQVQIHLLIVKGTPDFLCHPIRKKNILTRRAGLALIQHIHLLLIRLPVRPELLKAQEHIRIFRLVMLFQKVQEFRASSGKMIDHEIKHQLIILRQSLNILPGSELRIHFSVIDGGKPTVPGRREKRKYMDSIDFPFKIRIHHLLQFF